MRVKYLQCCYMLGEKEPFRIEAKALLNELMVSENVTEVIALSDFYLRHIQGKEAQNDSLAVFCRKSLCFDGIHIIFQKA